jgi:hypothetical protein
MRLHFEGDHPVDAARNVRQVLEFLAVAVAEGNPRADMLAGDCRGGLSVVLMALENTVDYIGQRCKELAGGHGAMRAPEERAYDS